MKQIEFYAKHQKKRSHDFKNHETFYVYIRFYILYNVTKVSHPKIMG